jgi:hypothetical protein
MEPNFTLETSALRFIYTEQLVVFQDERDTLLRDFEVETEVSSTTQISEPTPPEAPIISDQILVVETPQSEPTPTKVEELIVENIPVTKEAEQKQGLVVLGKNERNILVLLPGTRTDLKPEERDFLLKILAAKQLKGNDIGFVFEMENNSISSKAALLASKPQLVIAFGVKHNLLALMPATPYSLITENNILYLKSDALLKLTIDASLKKQLWSQLQPLMLG